ncbi:lipoprotein-releasing system permease protein [Flavobacterium croceum DSM 17960]|uniref:Lipoprotein-releasing system permease protein n=1 Tax=Flavobacterium croceum DSM 17960 TaxID=1121886 RepID=A0A2S4N554_9FLAO|nr:FtsX-like permease family protein [Flavobacterium croceum]POS00816.1 lipoprotein-releasing system permease protein [Flavobacterium croceum DSM 17960]
MKLEYFIAKRLVKPEASQNKFSKTIVNIAVTAVALGILMMVVSIATGMGLQNKIRDKVSSFNGHILISSFTGNESNVSVNPISLHQTFYPSFKNISGIKHIQGVASKAGIIRTSKAFEGVVFKGVGKDYDFTQLKDYLQQGRMPILNQELNNEVLISEYLVKRLQLKLGDSFDTFFMKEGQNKLPNFRRFKIVGIYNSGIQEFDASYLIIDLRHIQRMNKWTPNQVGNFEVYVSKFSEIEKKTNEVEQEIGSFLHAQSIETKYYYIFDWLKLFDSNIVLIIIVMLLVAVINMIVALLVLVLERIPMIGILKSLGMTNTNVRKIFLYNALYIVVKGLLIGNIIAISLLLIQKYGQIVKLNSENYYVTIAPVYINPLQIIALNLFVVVVIAIFLVIPTYIITYITPSKSIRFK